MPLGTQMKFMCKHLRISAARSNVELSAMHRSSPPGQRRHFGFLGLCLQFVGQGRAGLRMAAVVHEIRLLDGAAQHPLPLVSWRNEAQGDGESQSSRVAAERSTEAAGCGRTFSRRPKKHLGFRHWYSKPGIHSSWCQCRSGSRTSPQEPESLILGDSTGAVPIDVLALAFWCAKLFSQRLASTILPRVPPYEGMRPLGDFCLYSLGSPFDNRLLRDFLPGRLLLQLPT